MLVIFSLLWQERKEQSGGRGTWPQRAQAPNQGGPPQYNRAYRKRQPLGRGSGSPAVFLGIVSYTVIVKDFKGKEPADSSVK